MISPRGPPQTLSRRTLAQSIKEPPCACQARGPGASREVPITQVRPLRGCRTAPAIVWRRGADIPLGSGAGRGALAGEAGCGGGGRG